VISFKNPVTMEERRLQYEITDNGFKKETQRMQENVSKKLSAGKLT
jgi:hypothetical protein